MYAAYNGYPQVVKLLLGKKTFSTLLLGQVFQIRIKFRFIRNQSELKQPLVWENQDS